MVLRLGLAGRAGGLHGVRLGRIPGAVRTSIVRRSNHTEADPALSWLDPVARYLVSMPETMGLVGAMPYPYTASIIAMTLALRTGVSVPIALWQRSRNERLTNIVLPEWGVWKKQIPAAVWQRRASNNEVSKETEFQIQRQIHRSLAEKWNHLIALHDCSPTRTTIVSLAVHIPLFLLVTMLIRQGTVLPDTPLVHELIPWWAPDATFAAQASASQQILLDRGLDPVLVDKLTKVGGPTLADRDSTQIMPIVVGSLNMLNIELAQWVRERRLARERELGLGDSRAGANDGGVEAEPVRERVIGNVLRGTAVLSIPIACQVPAALLVYWTTSALVTLVQNAYFAWLDAKIK